MAVTEGRETAGISELLDELGDFLKGGSIQEFYKSAAEAEKTLALLENRVIAPMKKLGGKLDGVLPRIDAKGFNAAVRELNKNICAFQSCKDLLPAPSDGIVKSLNAFAGELNIKIAACPKDPPNGKVPPIKKLK